MEVYVVLYLQLSVTVYVSVHFCTYFGKFCKHFTASRTEYIENKSLTNEKLTVSILIELRCQLSAAKWPISRNVMTNVRYIFITRTSCDLGLFSLILPILNSPESGRNTSCLLLEPMAVASFQYWALVSLCIH